MLCKGDESDCGREVRSVCLCGREFLTLWGHKSALNSHTVGNLMSLRGHNASPHYVNHLALRDLI